MRRRNVNAMVLGAIALALGALIALPMVPSVRRYARMKSM